MPPPVFAPEDTVNSHDAGKEVQLKRQQHHREKACTENAGMFGKEMSLESVTIHVDRPEVVTLSN